ncbi:MAG: response regulator [Gemmatimonadota bacterium]|jgi:CheY-like chemotaxis protein
MRFDTALVVDDEPATRAVLRHILELSGLRVFEAENVRDGLARAHSEAPDLVLTDIRMPGTSGAEMASRMRQDPELAETTIVAVTYHPEDVRRKAHLFDLVMPKPVSVSHLRAWLRGEG